MSPIDNAISQTRRLLSETDDRIVAAIYRQSLDESAAAADHPDLRKAIRERSDIASLCTDAECKSAFLCDYDVMIEMYRSGKRSAAFLQQWLPLLAHAVLEKARGN